MRGFPGSGWSRSEAHRGGRTFCRRCGEQVTRKPRPGECDSTGHRRFYKSYRERLKLYMRRYSGKGRGRHRKAGRSNHE